MCEEDYDTVFKSIILKEKHLVDLDYADQFLLKNVRGEITKAKLDK